MSVRIAAGTAIAIVGRNLIALIDGNERSLVDRLAVIARDPDTTAEHVVDALTAVGIRSFPSFGIVVATPSGFTLFARGEVEIEIAAPEGNSIVAARQATSWSEVFCVDTTSFCLRVQSAGELEYWVETGLVPASQIWVGVEHFRAPGSELSSPGTSDSVGGLPLPAAEGDATREIRSSPPPPPPPPPSEYVPVASAAPFAAVKARAPWAPAADPDATSVFHETEATVGPERWADPVLIEGIPAALASLRENGARDGDGVEIPGDHDGYTVSIASARLARGVEHAAANGPSVQAVHCPSLHANPPHASQCRVCGEAIDDYRITVISRPSLGELRLSNGDVYTVDRPMLVGRKPHLLAAIGSDTELPRLVTVDDSKQLVSKVHLEIRVEDWQVLVVDHNSTNHTFVTLPGRETMQLPPSDPTQIVPGTIIDLGGAMTMRYEIGTPT